MGKLIVDKIEEFKEKLSVNTVFAALPCDDLSDAWMNDDFVTIEDTSDKEDSIDTVDRLLLSKDASTSDYDENDKETQMYAVPPKSDPTMTKEGRLSAIEEAKRFSCEEEEEEQLIERVEIVNDISICDDDESTSWA